MFVKLKAMPSIKWSNCLLATAAATLLISSAIIPTARGLSSVDERGARKLFGGYRITPKFCRPSKTLPKSDPRSEGPTICMFNHECAQRVGEVVGACMDGFLFGACCQVPGNIGTNLLPEHAQTPKPQSNLAAAQSYEVYGSQQNHNEINYQQVPMRDPQDNGFGGPMGGYYGASGNELENEANDGDVYLSNTNTIVEDHKTNQFYIQNEKVVISPNTDKLNDKVPSYFPSSTPEPSTSFTVGEVQYLPSNESYGPQHPVLITASNYGHTTPRPVHISGQIEELASDLIQNPLPVGLNDYNSEFTHSDITHPSADADLIEEDLQFSTGYGPSTVYVPAPVTESSISTTTEEIVKVPGFKRKPTSTQPPRLTSVGDDQYVLVQTINNEKPGKKPQSQGMTTNDIESIESIILMLNDTNHGPTYNSGSSTADPIKTTYSSSFGTQRPPLTTNNVNYDKFGSNLYTTAKPATGGISTHMPLNHHPSDGYSGLSINTPLIGTTSSPTTVIITTKAPYSHSHQTSTYRPQSLPSSSSSYHEPSKTTTTKRRPKPTPASSNTSQGSYSSTRKPTSRPMKTVKPPVTSYLTGPTTARPQSTVVYDVSTTTPAGYYATKFDSTPSPSNAIHLSSFIPTEGYSSTTQKIPSNHLFQSKPLAQKPIFVKIPGTQRPSPTVIITPKPTVNLVSTQAYTHQPTTIQHTTPLSAKLPSTSYIFNPIVTNQPNFGSNAPDYVGLPPPVVSNDFDDPGYHGQTVTPKPTYEFVTESVYTIQPINSQLYYGPTSSYQPFNVPTDSVYNTNVESEIYTSPNDFVNFPPVRNPNLNMSATSSSVTNDLDLSTPAFVEDDILKDKMNLLVSKIVASLQDNFDALADMVEERNTTVLVQSDTVATPVRQATTKRPTITTRRPAIRPPQRTTRRPTAGGRPGTTKKPVVITTKRKPVTRRPTTVVTTNKPISQTLASSRPTARPTKKPTTVIQNDVIEEDDEDTEEDTEDDDVGEELPESDEISQGGRRLQCGIRPHIKSARIVGGKGSAFGEWPWQVLVRESTWLGLFTKNKCGGVLITNKFVMTAAHCQPGFLASLVAVFGEFDISGDLEIKRSVTKNVKRVIVHRQYDAATFENDLALLELESPIHYDTHIVPICMPSDTAEFTGRMATVTGWGRLKYGGGVPTILQEVQVPIIENSVCQEMFHTAGHKKKILPSFLCAGYANGMKDSCEGDSGGPLVMQRGDGRWELAGTVSHGIQCAAPYLPGVYMRTTFYKPWLKSITGVK